MGGSNRDNTGSASKQKAVAIHTKTTRRCGCPAHRESCKTGCHQYNGGACRLIQQKQFR
jgi:hypothetical protein